ncbi:hypothetical protein [Rhodoferax sp.]|uniref:hypothetical protein n=1 Tax=Rhodoferax sp. TaxID=50421 RepID=UPI0019EE9DE2|nr:hypothetical protein [Rhodoferax sp.]MBE0473956.1 hypothetical protein [Rhodoferax sp.]
MTALQAERATLDDELAFYAKDPGKAPPKLKRQVSELTQSLAAQERFMAEQDSEIERINARFDQYLLRLLPMWRARQGSESPAPGR